MNDSSIESRETFRIVLTGPEGHVEFANLWVTIRDDDRTTAPSTPVPPPGGSGGGGAIDLSELVVLVLILAMASLRWRRLKFTRVRL